VCETESNAMKHGGMRQVQPFSQHISAGTVSSGTRKLYQMFSFCQTNRTAGKMDKTDIARIRYHGGAFVQPFLQWKNNKSVSAALGMQHAICMRDTITGGLSASTVFFYIIL